MQIQLNARLFFIKMDESNMKPTKISEVTQALLIIAIFCIIEWALLVKLLHI